MLWRAIMMISLWILNILWLMAMNVQVSLWSLVEAWLAGIRLELVSLLSENQKMDTTSTEAAISNIWLLMPWLWSPYRMISHLKKEACHLSTLSQPLDSLKESSHTNHKLLSKLVQQVNVVEWLSSFAKSRRFHWSMLFVEKSKSSFWKKNTGPNMSWTHHLKTFLMKSGS